MKNRCVFYDILLISSFLFLLSNSATAEILMVEVENKTVSIDTPSFHTNFNCEKDSRYEIPLSSNLNYSEMDGIKNSLIGEVSSSTKSLGNCEAKLQLCQQDTNSNTFKSEEFTKTSDQLNSCEKQREFFGYERLAFLAAFMAVVLIAFYVGKRGCKCSSEK